MSDMTDIMLAGSSLWEEKMDQQPRERKRYSIRCKYCGEYGFQWEDFGPGKWRLAKNGKLHNCRG